MAAVEAFAAAAGVGVDGLGLVTAAVTDLRLPEEAQAAREAEEPGAELRGLMPALLAATVAAPPSPTLLLLLFSPPSPAPAPVAGAFEGVEEARNAK